jgi:hypothetical protein
MLSKDLLWSICRNIAQEAALRVMRSGTTMPTSFGSFTLFARIVLKPTIGMST